MKKQLFVSILFCILCYACQQKETISPFSNDNTGNTTSSTGGNNSGNTTPSSTGSGNTATAQGRATFWTSQSTGWSTIDVYIGGAFAGSIKEMIVRSKVEQLKY